MYAVANEVLYRACALKLESAVQPGKKESGTMRSEPKRSVEADEFVLRDTNGLMRAALKMTADGPCLFFYDHREKVRAGLLGGKNAPRLFLLDRDGKPRTSLGLAADDSAEKQIGRASCRERV